MNRGWLKASGDGRSRRQLGALFVVLRHVSDIVSGCKAGVEMSDRVLVESLIFGNSESVSVSVVYQS